jgi:tetratricopeptide (TPR) repeat protein
MSGILGIIDKMQNFLLKALIILTPLFFLLNIWGQTEISRQIFVSLIAILSVVLLLIKSARWQFLSKNSYLDLPVIIFLFGFFLSALISNDAFVSFFGSYGRFNDGFIGVFGLVSVYFLLTSSRLSYKIFDIQKVIYFSILISSLLFFFISFLSLIFPFSGLERLFSGNLSPAFSIISSIMLVYSLNLLDYTKIRNRSNRIYLLGIFVSLIILTFINFRSAWACLAVGALTSLMIKFFFKDKFNRINFYSLALFVAAPIFILFFINSAPALSKNNKYFSGELMLDKTKSIALSLASLDSREIFGSGPGSFGRIYDQYKHLTAIPFDQWLVRFNKPQSFLIEILSTSGWLGFATYVSIFIIFIVGSFKLINYLKNDYTAGSKPDNGFIIDQKNIIANFSAIVGLFAAQIIFPLDSIILFYFFVFLAAMILYFKRLFYRDDFTGKKENFVKIRKAFMSLFLLSVLPILFWVLSIQINLVRADFEYQKNPNVESILIDANILAPNRYNYKLTLSRFYLDQAKSLMSNGISDEGNRIKLERRISDSIEYANAARNLAPYNSEVYMHLGLLYRDISSVTAGSEERAISSFLEALELEPENPVYLNELGKLFLQKKMYIEAEDNFKSAVNMNPDFKEARFGLAKAYSVNNKEDEALGILADLETNSSDIEIYFEEGRILFNRKKYNEAINKFLEVLKKYPNHANTLYSLGLTLDAIGRYEEAVPYFKKVLEFNPNNQFVIKKIKELESKK